MTLLEMELDFFPSLDLDFPEVLDFNNFFTPTVLEKKRTRRVPATNVKEKEDAFEIEIATPGVMKEDLHLRVENGILRIFCGNEKSEGELSDYRVQEFSFGHFDRYFSLPENVDSKNVKAKLENGVLKLIFKKTAVSTSPDKISII